MEQTRAVERVLKSMITQQLVNQTNIAGVKSHLEMIYAVGFDKGVTVNKGGIEISQYDLKGNFIRDYDSLSQAARITGISIGDIHLVCNNKRVKAGGFKWKVKST